MTTALVPYGMSPREYGRIIQWAVRRSKYGDNGLSALGARTVGAGGRRGRLKQVKRLEGRLTCKNGHPWSKDTTRLTKGRRQCLLCEGRRPKWITRQLARVNVQLRDKVYRKQLLQLRAAVVAAHPDRPGGTKAKAQVANRALDTFEAQQIKLYWEDTGLPPPRVPWSHTTHQARGWITRRQRQGEKSCAA